MKICVYGASSSAIDAVYLRAGEALGQQLARRGHGLVFGGGANGMMGAVARGAQQEHGEILGIAPSFFQVDGVLFDGCTDFIYTQTMNQRKERMEREADAFVMTAGGIGTYEEFFEVFTLLQLGLLRKPLAILNTHGYFDPLLALLARTAEEKFMQKDCLSLYAAFSEPEALLDYLESWQDSLPDTGKLRLVIQEETV